MRIQDNNSSRGFTLIELLVSLVIFAIMSAGVFSIFNSFQTVKDITDRDSKRLYEYQKAFTVLGRDIQQMAPRPIKDEFGTDQPALKGEDNIIEFTRAGWNRPPFIKTRRSELQRVKYVIEEGGLQRYYWDVLDRADTSLPRQVLVLEGVEEIKFKYFRKTDQNDIREEFSWPVQSDSYVSSSDTTSAGNSAGSGNTGQRCGIASKGLVEIPIIVEVTIVTSEFGELVKKYLIPNEYADAVLQSC